MQAPDPDRGRWCDEHQRRECVSQRKHGGDCHNDKMVRGSDKCRMHLGKKSAAVIAEAEAEKAVATYGLRRDIPATDALLEEVQWTAGHVAWLREKVRELEDADLIWGITEQVDKQASEFAGVDTTSAAKPNMWLELYYRERKHLVDVCKAAISVGLEERRVNLAEAQGQVVVDVIKRIIARLALSDEQTKLVSLVVPEELRRAAGALGLN